VRLRLLDGDHVVAHDLQVNRRIELTDALHQVVGERIVVVDEQNSHDESGTVTDFVTFHAREEKSGTATNFACAW